jgi:adenylate cyclase
VINSSPGDLAPVFDAILDKAHTLCGAEFGSLFLYDGEHFRALASHGVPEALASRLREGIGANDSRASQQLIAGAPFAHIHDSALEEGTVYRGMDMVSSHRTLLSVPLRKCDAVLGIIVAGRLEVRPFTDKQIAPLQNFAVQAVIAILESHRREIVVVFCDLRGYTAFTETAEPEEVLDFLREYHGVLGPLISQYEGTLDQFSGDGIMVFFNDPVPCPDPAERAVKMAMAMREAAGTLIANWRRRGRPLGFGAGIAQGYANLGQIGFAERSGYTAIGTVCNLAARLCAEAKDGQILVAQRVAVAVEETIRLEEVGALTLKGLTQPVVAYNVPLAPIQPALRIIEGGPQSV